MAMREANSPVFVGVMQGVQLKTVAKLARQISISIGKPVILFSDLKSDSMAGVGVDINKNGLYKASDNDYIKNIMAHDDETFLVAIMTKAFEGFKDEVLQKAQYIKDVKAAASAKPAGGGTKKVDPPRKPIMSGGKPISMHNEDQDKGNFQEEAEVSSRMER